MNFCPLLLDTRIQNRSTCFHRDQGPNRETRGVTLYHPKDGQIMATEDEIWPAKSRDTGDDGSAPTLNMYTREPKKCITLSPATGYQR